jgi:hypothetical protein
MAKGGCRSQTARNKIPKAAQQSKPRPFCNRRYSSLLESLRSCNRCHAERRVAIFQREYIDPGTVGLEDLNRIGRVDAEGLAKIIESYANYYKAIRQVTLDIGKQRAETVSAFRKLKELYPPASFPDTYFAIGHFEGGGTASNNGLLINAEHYARAPEVPTTELGEWEKAHAQTPSELPTVIAHEMVHFHQAYSSQDSLLCKCLNEGSADFVSELTVGRLVAPIQKAHEWADPRERQLWEEFQKDMNGTDISHWLMLAVKELDRTTWAIGPATRSVRLIIKTLRTKSRPLKTSSWSRIVTNF